MKPTPPELGQRRLFAYWKVDFADIAMASQAVHSLHRHWRTKYPGLKAMLFLREDTDTQATLMETYALAVSVSAGGVDQELQTLINRACDDTTSPWRRGQRHVEVFLGCDDRDPWR